MNYVYADKNTLTVTQKYSEVRNITNRMAIDALGGRRISDITSDLITKLTEIAFQKVSQLPDISFVALTPPTPLTPAQTEEKDRLKSELIRIQAEYAVKYDRCIQGGIAIAADTLKDTLYTAVTSSLAITFPWYKPIFAAWDATNKAEFFITTLPEVINTLKACNDIGTLNAEILGVEVQLRSTVNPPTISPMAGGSPQTSTGAGAEDPRRNRGGSLGEQPCPDIHAIGEDAGYPGVLDSGRRAGKGFVTKSITEENMEFWKQELPALLKSAASIPDGDILVGSKMVTSVWLYYAIFVVMDEIKKKHSQPAQPAQPPKQRRQDPNPEGPPGGYHGGHGLAR